MALDADHAPFARAGPHAPIAQLGEQRPRHARADAPHLAEHAGATWPRRATWPCATHACAAGLCGCGGDVASRLENGAR